MDARLLLGPAVAFVIFIFALVAYLRRDRKSEGEAEEAQNKGQDEAKTIAGTAGGKHPLQGTSKSKVSETAAGSHGRKKETRSFTHQWLASSLKGHASTILDLDFSPNGKYLVTAAEDRTVFLWSTKDFKQKTHRFVRGNVEYDHAKLVKFSPDSRALVTCLATANTIRVLKFSKKDDGDVGNIAAALEDFPKEHVADIVSIGIATNGKYIMTCDSETKIIIWDLKGAVLTKIDTSQVKNNYAAVSPCGRFVASCGFTPDVKVWEIEFDKGGNFRTASRAFELKGHSAGVLSFSFSADSNRVVSVSKDGTWRLWNIEVEYKKNQDAYMILTGHCKDAVTSSTLIALSPDARVAAVAYNSNVIIFNTATGAEEVRIADVHDIIKSVQFHVSGRYFVTTGDRHVHVFHNVPGLRASITDFENKKKASTTQAMKERLQQQIDEARSLLTEIGSC